jgi:hypothetical protein
MTTMTTTTVAASVGSNVETDTAALLRQWLTTQGKRNIDVDISVSPLLHDIGHYIW